jgi:hypothetical protein
MKVFITLTWLLLATSFAYAQDALVNKENYLIGVFVKDGRYRYEITNIRYQDYGADAQKLPAETHFVDGYYKMERQNPLRKCTAKRRMNPFGKLLLHWRLP